MTKVALLPSVLGVGQGVLDAAERMRHDGHDGLLVDLYGGRTLDDQPDSFVSAGFSSKQPLLARPIET